MKIYKRMISIVLASAALLSVLVFCSGCGKQGQSGSQTAAPTGGSATERPSQNSGDKLYRPYIPENWGLDPESVILDVSIAGKERSYTVADIYRLGHVIIRVNDPEALREIITYSGIRLGALLKDLGVDPADLDPSTLVLKDFKGNTVEYNGDAADLDLEKCFIGMMQHSRLSKKFKRTVFIPIIDKDTGVRDICNGITYIEIS